jgi:hypothetical protein
VISWKDAAKIGLIFFVFFDLFLCAAFGVQSGILPTSPQQSQEGGANSEFMIVVGEDGKAVYEAAEGVSEELREELLSTTYSSFEAALEASHNDAYGEPPNVAYAHAVKKCTTSELGKVSLDFGYSRHVTFHHYDRGSYRYTTTYHQHLTHWGWQTNAKYKAKIPKSRC